MTKKVTAPTLSTEYEGSIMQLNTTDSVTAAALRGVALTRGRAPTMVAARTLGGVYTAAAAAAAGFRHATPLAAAPTAFPYASLYQDQFLAVDASGRYQLVSSQPFATAASAYPAGAARYAIPATAVAAPMAYAAAGYGREYAADPYIGHTIGPVAGYGAAVYRGGYQRFAPY
jgi:RNA binding protein fox-1